MTNPAVTLREQFTEYYKQTNLGHKLVIDTKYAKAATKQAVDRDMKAWIREETKRIDQATPGFSDN